MDDRDQGYWSAVQDILSQLNAETDPVTLARQIVQERARGGGAKRLLIDQYPTKYLPNIGRQVMADGGAPDDGTHPAWIPTRLVTSKKAKPGAEGQRDIVDYQTLRSTPDVFQHNVDLVRAYPNITQKMSRIKSHDKLAEHFIGHVADNLLALHDAVPEQIRSRSRLWYDGARKITDDWSQKYGVPDHSVAGALAALSPQKDWYQNVSLAERVLDAMKGQGGNFYKGFAADDAMENKFRSIASLNKEKYEPLFQLMRGKTLSDLDAVEGLTPDAKARMKAIWIRLHDETYNDKSHPIVTPEGGFGQPVMTDKGMPAKVGWGSLGEMAKAIRAIEAADDPASLSELMGERHKVRNFYNNILNPNSPNGDVTIDTHAVAAGLYRPLSGNSLEVSHNFKNHPGKGLPAASGTALTGIQGLYPIYAEAYRRAAEQRGILPREMQSITWEAVRGLFPDTFKTKKNNALVDDVWNGYRRGQYNQAEARSKIDELAGGVRPPSWFVAGDGGADAAPQDPRDAGELSGAGVLRQGAEGVKPRARGGATSELEEGARAEVTNGDRYERSQEGPFYRLARKDLAGDRRVSEGLRPEVREAAGADPRGAGEAGRGDPALSAPGQAPGVESVPHRIARDYVRNVHGRDLVAPNLDSSLTKQSAIGRSFAEAVKGAPEYKAAIFDAYSRMMPEVVEQSGATNYDQLLERAYRQMAQETSQQFETLPFRMSFHRAGEGDYPTSKHMLDDLHNNNHLYVFQGGDPHEFLHNVDPETGLNENEKFRAVHDVFGHGIYGNPFGAKGEENAWATHSQMYSPLARLAMTAETRGQNSFVNYTPINALLKEKIAEVEEKIADARRSRNEYSMQSALKKKGDLYKQFQFAPQKSVLLPPEFLDPEYKGGMPEYMRSVIKPEPGTGFSSALTHYSTVPDMERTDPSRYGTGIPGDEASRLRSRPGGVKERSYFYLGEPEAVTPEEGLGSYRYRAEASDLYDITKDPLNLKPLARESNRMPWSSNFNPGTVEPGQFANDLERLVKEYGYKGFANPNAAFPMAVTFDPTQVERRATGGEVGDETPYHQTSEFQNWFGDSVAHMDGVPVTYYHGTSKDKDFPSFNVGRHGVWLTSDPEEASQYAEQNDSQNYTYEGGRYVKTNTASRVIPVHLKAENPYLGEKPEELFQQQNYKKAQSDWFDGLRAQGYDSWIPASQNGALAVILKEPTQIKSIYNRKFDPKNKRMDKAVGGEAENPDIPQIDNAMSIFPKPQRMFPEDAPVAGGQYLNAATKEDMTGHKAAMASIGVQPGGKPYFRASPDSVDETGTPGRGSAIAKTNLFKQKAGWKWAQAPEGHEATDTIVSVAHRGQHHYTLNAHFPKGVDLARYENSPTEPRLRPTTKGNVTFGPKVGSILVRGKEHPVYEHVIVKNMGGEVSGKKASGGHVATLRRMSDPAVNEAIRVINRSGSSPRDAVTLSKRLLGRQ